MKNPSSSSLVVVSAFVRMLRFDAHFSFHFIECVRQLTGNDVSIPRSTVVTHT